MARQRRERDRKFKVDLIVGFDTEFVRGTTDDLVLPEDEDRTKTNPVLCYTFCALDPNTGLEHTGLTRPSGLSRRHRLSVASFVAYVFKALAESGKVVLRDKLSIILAAHFTRADLCGFRDFPKIKTKFDAVRGTYATTQRPFVIGVRIGAKRVRVSIRLVDTLLLAPASHRSLAAIGELLGVDKIKLKPGEIERMDLLQETDPERFARYAIRDAVIAARYCLEVWRFSQDKLAIGAKLPPTIGSAGVVRFVQDQAECERDISQLLGRRGRSPDKAAPPWLDKVGDIVPFAADAYHGGRNEAFTCGFSPMAQFSDVDLRGAYTTILADICQPNWDGIVSTKDLGVLAQLGAGISIARVKFAFPQGTRFPCLPVRAGDHGLIFPRTGVSQCTGAELVLARGMGAQLDVERGEFVPYTAEARRFADYTKKINELRGEFPKGSLFEKLAKECGNSLYGKLGQGVSNLKINTTPTHVHGRGANRVFDSRAGEMKPIPLSRISQPVFAAHITGLCRAAVSELLFLLPPDAIVVSVTTDGFLANVPLSAVDTRGPIMRHFTSLRRVVSGEDEVVEVKHTARQVVSVRTRGCLTPVASGDRADCDPILSRAGQRLADPPRADDMPGETADARARAAAWAENDEWVKIYQSRDFDLRHRQIRRVSLRMQWEDDSDLVDDERDVRVSLDYDFKRVPLNVTERSGCVAFDATRAPEDVDEFLRLRGSFDRWRKGKERVLRTLSDWQEFVEFRQVGSENAHRRASRRGRSRFETAVIRAWARGEIGFPARGRGHGSTDGWTETKIAEAMVSVGIKATRGTVNQAARVSAHKIAKVSAQDLDLARRVVGAIPGFRPRLFELAAPGSSAEAQLMPVCARDH